MLAILVNLCMYSFIIRTCSPPYNTFYRFIISKYVSFSLIKFSLANFPGLCDIGPKVYMYNVDPVKRKGNLSSAVKIKKYSYSVIIQICK